ncbi:NTF2-like protein [Sistotremastrum niveocremeum HHB9708]|uniref:NTF2-like protein n=2 Tax=Sistotremastraceae TaxID=3402574 RepID=A0A164UFT9_9AGAM|nr:NTF2-like protein [Sistotremastrum niveocremeum HHB9708]KZT42615.1 NTF2-like protein [Sistotremastrum suecicum HHB10207 ss-3]
MTTLAKADIEISAQAARAFVQLYYPAYDSAGRDEDVPKFYRSYSSILWNGNPVTGADALKDFLKGIPTTAHEVLTYDCHPIPNTKGPSLMISVSGTVRHGPDTGPLYVTGPNGKEKPKSKTVDGQPRVFSQTFVLVPDPDAPAVEPGKLGKYVVSADSFRFVG